MLQSTKFWRVSRQSRLAISERRLLLASGDMLLIVVSIFGSLWFWSKWSDRPLTWTLWQEQILWAAFIFGSWSAWLLCANLYNLRVAVTPSASYRKIGGGGLTIAFCYLLLFFFISPRPIIGSGPGLLHNLIPNSLLPRLAPSMAIASSTMLLLIWRLTFARVLSEPQTRRRLLIVGAGQAGTALCQAILREHSAHYHILGFIDDDPLKQQTSIYNIAILGGHDHLASIARQYRVDEIAIAISSEVRGSLLQAVMDCYEQGISITPMPLLYERLTGKITVEHIGSQWYIALPIQQHPASLLFSFLKRVGDLFFGLIATLLFMAVFPCVALAIKLDSAGPVFYTQERAGRHGRLFQVRKFRSMVHNAEQDGRAAWAVRDDPRITRIGRLLRKTRLDELPQMLNVLRGEMSLVGPRPERPQFIDQLQHQIPFYRKRLSAKPGLTGWAQVNYGYGSTVDDALIKLQYDLYYIKHQSPWLDLLIMLRTIGVVLKMKGQ